jgi:hypothetical protein
MAVNTGVGVRFHTKLPSKRYFYCRGVIYHALKGAMNCAPTTLNFEL